MAKRVRLYDALITYSARDSALALTIAQSGRERQLEFCTDPLIVPGVGPSEVLRQVIAEIRELIVILRPSELTEWMTFEVGAAQGWNKPILAITPDPRRTSLLAALRGTELFPIGRVQDLIVEIERIVEQVTDDDRTFLSRLFTETGLTLDELADDSDRLEELAKRFKKGRHKAVSEDRLYSELLRLRKQGRLRRNRSQPTTLSA